MAYYVYQIQLNDIIYYGRTTNLNKRLTQHINFAYNPNHKQYNKVLYQQLRTVYPDKESGSKAIKTAFKSIRQFKTLADSKRFEIFLILTRYFDSLPLYQKIPNISDR